MSGLAPPVAAQAPSREKPVRIGILALRSPGVTSPLIALMQGLRELGYVQGRNLVVEHPDAFGRDDRLPQIAEDMVRSGVDVILVIGPAPLEAARKATKTIPLVMVASSSDPVADGVAASLARPGGNTTGLTYAEPDRFQKQLELLKSAAVHVARLAVLWDFDVAIYRRSWEASLKDAGRRLGLSIEEPVVVRDPHELPAAFVLLKQRHVEAILVASGGFLLQDRAQVGSLALRHRIPAIAAFKQFAQAGLLMSYGPDLPDINYRAAAFVDKILRGAKPGNLPIELPNKFELAINLKTAQGLGLTIPQALLIRANEVIQ